MLLHIVPPSCVLISLLSATTFFPSGLLPKAIAYKFNDLSLFHRCAPAEYTRKSSLDHFVDQMARAVTSRVLKPELCILSTTFTAVFEHYWKLPVTFQV
ncbi:hypothetical protein EDD15DRAFT_384029 [Pisolithus albus]|nr:hypothetical protein EDD15DRAFT_384029 [Pisolithus albus]